MSSTSSESGPATAGDGGDFDGDADSLATKQTGSNHVMSFFKHHIAIRQNDSISCTGKLLISCGRVKKRLEEGRVGDKLGGCLLQNFMEKRGKGKIPPHLTSNMHSVPLQIMV